MTIITDVYAREVLDSRGNPTVEVEVYLSPAHSDAQSFHLVHLLVPTKRLSFAMVTNPVTLVKAYCKLLKT